MSEFRRKMLGVALTALLTIKYRRELLVATLMLPALLAATLVAIVLASMDQLPLSGGDPLLHAETSAGAIASDAAMAMETAAPESTGAGFVSAPPQRPALQEVLWGCGQAEEECVRDFVAEVAPEAEYAGGRTDLRNDPAPNRSVFYFVDPTRGVCEYEKFEGGGSDADVYYVLLIAGEGSFDERQTERGEAVCLPEL
jgi:hypothetical protein